MERQKSIDPKTIEDRNKKIEVDIKTALEHGVHIDAAVNPFIKEEDRQTIIEGKVQDPEWD
jgi:hypothetical protein